MDGLSLQGVSVANAKKTKKDSTPLASKVSSSPRISHAASVGNKRISSSTPTITKGKSTAMVTPAQRSNLSPPPGAVSPYTNVLKSPVFNSSVTSAVEGHLVDNLRKQVSCLEAQINCLRQQIDTREADQKPPSPVRADDATPSQGGPGAAGGKGQVEAKGGSGDSESATIAALHFDMERLVLDCSRLHEECHRLQQEKSGLTHHVMEVEACLKDAERAILASDREKQRTLEALSMAQTSLLELEGKALREGAEGKSARFEDMLHQRDFYRLQAERLELRESLLSARVDALRGTAKADREEIIRLKAELHEMADRLHEEGHRQRKEHAFYEQLGQRFVSVAGLLRAVVESKHHADAAVLEEVLKQPVAVYHADPSLACHDQLPPPEPPSAEEAAPAPLLVVEPAPSSDPTDATDGNCSV